MKRHRFHAPPEEIRGALARLSEGESHHLRDVLRLRVGDAVELFDGCGGAYPAVVRGLGERVELELQGARKTAAVAPLYLALALAVIKERKFEWVLQKGTELGLQELFPLATRYSQKSPDRRDRWRQIALAAAKQCGRAESLHIQAPVRLADLCAQPAADWDLRLAVTERGGRAAARLAELPPQRRILILVGPEGGWADQELELIRAHGFECLGLGDRILRSETAALAILTILQYLWGDLGGGGAGPD